MTFDLNHYFNYYLLEGRPITVRIYENMRYPSLFRDIKKYLSDKSPNKKLDITEFSVYIFVKLVKKEDNQIITFNPEYLEVINDFSKDLFTNGMFTADVAAITADDYILFFEKFKRKPWTKEQLKKTISKKLYKYLDRWDPKKANLLLLYKPSNHRIDLVESVKSPA